MITGDRLPSVELFFARVSVKVGDKEGDLSEPSTTISKVCVCDGHFTSAIYCSCDNQVTIM